MLHATGTNCQKILVPQMYLWLCIFRFCSRAKLYFSKNSSIGLHCGFYVGFCSMVLYSVFSKGYFHNVFFYFMYNVLSLNGIFLLLSILSLFFLWLFLFSFYLCKAHWIASVYEMCYIKKLPSPCLNFRQNTKFKIIYRGEWRGIFLITTFLNILHSVFLCDVYELPE